MRDIADRKQLIAALLEFREKRKALDTALSRVHYDPARGNVVASSGSRLLVVRLGEPDQREPFYLDESELKNGRLIEDAFDRAYPDYLQVTPRKTRLFDFGKLTVPDWLKHYSRSVRRSEIWVELEIDPASNRSRLIIPPVKNRFRLDALDALHGLECRVFELDNTLLFEHDDDDPDWYCVVMTRPI